MRYKYIFFDLAFTLLHKEEVYLIIENILKKHGFNVPLQNIIYAHKIVSETLEIPDKTSTEFYKYFNPLFLNALGIVSDLDISFEIYENCRKLDWKTYEDCSALQNIDIPKGIISNWDKSLDSKINYFFGNQFDTIIGSADTGFKKPSLEIFELAINLVNVKASEILYIGDSIKLDYKPASKLGISVYLIDRHNFYPYSNCNKITSLNQIQNILKND